MDELLLGTLFGRDREHIFFRKGNLAPKSKSHSPNLFHAMARSVWVVDRA